MAEETKKDFSITFEDIAGGTEPVSTEKSVETKLLSESVMATEEKPKEEVKVAVETKKTEKATEVYIPVPTSNDGSTWEIKPLEDITGEEFIKWANNLCAYPEHLLPSAALLDKLPNKKRYFANIVTLFKDSLVAQYKSKGIDLLDIKN